MPLDDKYYQYSLMPEEINNFRQFKERHSTCNPEIREAMIEEVVAPTLSSIQLRMTSIGMWPFAYCEVCNTRENIGCDERADSA